VQATERSLEEIEDSYWGEPPADATRLIATVHTLRRRPVGQLGVEDLRVMIAQRVGLPVLVPLALARLEQNPLAEGDFYPGDLLVATTRIPPEYWQSHGAESARLRAIVASIDPAEVDGDTRNDLAAFLGTSD
jgi:hypothetical protein